MMLNVGNQANLHGLRVAVTGGTSGLGLELVKQFCQAGAHVAFVARTQRRVAEIADQTGATGLVGDVGLKDDIYPLAMQTTASLGGLDVLINNASTLGVVPLRPLADTACEDFEDTLNVNLLGPFRFTNAVYGALAESARDRGTAAVVNISSDAGVSAYPNWGAYGTSKAATKQLSAIWDEESKPFGIRFLAIEPGDMNTPLHFAAIPDADPKELKHPADSATEIVASICDVLHPAKKW